MNAPIIYKQNFVSNPKEILEKLARDLEWQRRDLTPRSEYYCNDTGKSYIYGVGKGQREYLAQPYHADILSIRKQIEEVTKTAFEVCFLNRYLNQSDSLGWHSDDSPEMDDTRPIAIVSLGVERQILFRKYIKTICGLCAIEIPNHATPNCRGPELTKNSTIRIYSEIQSLKLESGSLCLMQPGMQNSWQHRIPRASFKCGERISLTYRGYVNSITNKYNL